jgi:DNA-binding NtrC family response regulator
VETKDARILVIDDEPMMTDSLRQNLAEEGYRVDTATTGAEAVSTFEQGGHHLAICDLQLPDMDGMAVLRHMKEVRPATEVIVVTGYGTVARAIEATKAGAAAQQGARTVDAARRKHEHAAPTFDSFGVLEHYRGFETDAGNLRDD